MASDSHEPGSAWTSRGARALGGLTIALAVASWLVPGDGPTAVEIGGPLTVGWGLLALVVMGTGAWRRCPRASGADGLVLTWFAWVVLAAVVVVLTGSGWVRPAKALAWQSVGASCLYVLGRWIWTDPRLGRWGLALLLGGIGLLASLASFQAAIRMPQERAGYFEASEQEKQRLLIEAGVSQVEPQSRARRSFEDRLRSLEPTASFSLANSLAVLLGVGWTVGLYVAFPPRARTQGATQTQAGEERSGRLRFFALAIVLLGLVAIAAMLVLTKSRAAVLAAGLATLVWAIEWIRLRGAVRWLLGGSIAAGLGIAAAFATGYLDIQVLTQAPKSFAYRVEYWRATLPMIASAPWFGVGPGSFQDRYREFQLPQASETVADPHNAWIEAAAVSGLPAGLALLALTLLAVMRAWPGKRKTDELSGHRSRPAASSSAVAGALYDPTTVGPGIFIGMLVAAPLLVFQGMFPDLTAWGCALVPGIVFGVACGWLINRAEPDSLVLERRAVGAGLAVAGATLLVTGGYGFWGVLQVVWWLLGSWITLTATPQSTPQDGGKVVRKVSAARPVWWCWAFGGLMLLVGVSQVVTPQLLSWRSRLEVRIALASGNPRRVEAALKEWVAVDPDSEEPWRWLYEVSFSRWRSSDRAEDRQQWDAAVARFEELRPRYAGHHLTLGGSYLAIWGERQRPELLEAAVRNFREAAELSPHDALTQAQLARGLQLSGQWDEARKVAARSLELDGLNPHRDRELRLQFLMGPEGPETVSAKVRLEEILGAAADAAIPDRGSEPADGDRADPGPRS